MIKIAIIGAGSEWGRRLGTDIMSYDWHDQVTIHLMDTAADHLVPIAAVTRKAVEVHHLEEHFVIEDSTDREAALKDADYVIATFATGGDAYNGKTYASDVVIPYKYGVKQAVADTINPGGIFRALRTAPVLFSLLDDMARICPKAYLLNYVNPMAILTWAANAHSSIPFIGLCHSVQGTSRHLSRELGVPFEEVTFKAAGINHLSWFTKFEWKGRDMLPEIRKIANDSEHFKGDQVRAELCRQFGYFVTESTRHASEYLPYFRKRDELIRHYDIAGGHVPDNPSPTPEELYDFLIKKLRWTDDAGRPERVQRQIAGTEPILLEKTYEYAAEIIYAVQMNQPMVFNGNVINHGAITNLPYDCCVEVPCTADGNGFHPHFFGELPSQLAALCQSNINLQRLTVEAILQRDLEKARYAMFLDPLTAAVCSPTEITAMFNEMVEAQKPLLEYYF